MSTDPGIITPVFAPKPVLGQRVRFTATLTRDVQYVTTATSSYGPRRYRTRMKVWRRNAFQGPQEGILVGIRTLADGEANYIDDEAGYGFNPTVTHRAALIATRLHLKPVLAFMSDVTLLFDAEGNPRHE